MSTPHPLDNTRLRWNIDFQSVRPAGLKPAEKNPRSNASEHGSETAEYNSAGHTGHSPMFRFRQ